MYALLLVNKYQRRCWNDIALYLFQAPTDSMYSQKSQAR